MEGFDPSRDRTDAILMYLLTGEDREEVMQNWLPEDKPQDEDDPDNPTKVADFSI